MYEFSLLKSLFLQNKSVSLRRDRLPLHLYVTELSQVLPPHALKGQKLLAQGIALGYYGRKPVAL
ncbi:hypothetical protein F8Q87_10205 [Prevotella copri]|nr:hypothetical protein [Segatella copri]MBM0157242.1 hypothetical protein [Segatella copri]QNT66216.1 hypothetical protein FO447_06510 [Segatella copri]